MWFVVSVEKGLGSFKHTTSKESNVQCDVTQHPPQFLSLLPTAEEWYQMWTLGDPNWQDSWVVPGETHPPKWIYANLSRNTNYVSAHVLLQACRQSLAHLALQHSEVSVLWPSKVSVMQSWSDSSLMIAKRTSLGGGAYETSFALGVAGAPSSTASRVSRKAPLSRTQSHEFSASLGYPVPFSRNVLQQRCSPIVPLTRHNSGWSFSMSWKETYLICLCSFCGLSKRDGWRSSTVSWKSF